MIKDRFSLLFLDDFTRDWRGIAEADLAGASLAAMESRVNIPLPFCSLVFFLFLVFPFFGGSERVLGGVWFLVLSLSFCCSDARCSCSLGFTGKKF